MHLVMAENTSIQGRGEGWRLRREGLRRGGFGRLVCLVLSPRWAGVGYGVAE